MAGQNVFAFTGSAFVPADRDLTATITYLPSSSVSYVYSISTGIKTQIWQGFPPTVTDLTAVDTQPGTFPNKANSVALTWSLASGALTASQNVYLKIGAGSYALIASGLAASARSYTYGFIPANTDYAFYVETVSVANLKRQSTPVTARISGAVSLSTFTGAAISSSRLDFTWTMPNTLSYQRFFIQYSTDNATWGTATQVNANLSSTSFTVSLTGLSEVSLRYARVYAFDYNGYQSPFSFASATTLAIVPSAPSVTTWAILGSGSMTLAYTTPYNGGSAITKYQYSTNGSTWIDNPPATVTGLPLGTSITVYVRAVNAIGNGAAGTKTTTTANVPSAPVATLNTDGCDTAAYSWTVPANNGLAITKYEYRISIDDATYGAAVDNAMVTTFDRTVTYVTTKSKIQARATNACGTSGWGTESGNNTPWVLTYTDAQVDSQTSTITTTRPCTCGDETGTKTATRTRKQYYYTYTRASPACTTLGPVTYQTDAYPAYVYPADYTWGACNNATAFTLVNGDTETSWTTQWVNDINGANPRLVERREIFGGMTFADPNPCHPDVCGSKCTDGSMFFGYALYEIWRCSKTNAIYWANLACI
jgi:hypothetical protein